VATEVEQRSFTDSVKELLAGQEDAESLWLSVAQEFLRDGPDAASEYPAGVKQGLVERVRRLLDDVEGRVDG